MRTAAESTGELLMVRFSKVMQVAILTTLAATAQETAPTMLLKSYDCYHTKKPLKIDGKAG